MPAGVYGKYPAKRDFVATNLPRSVLAPFEAWLQGGMAASRESLGRAWESAFLVQPIWSFWIGASVTGVDCAGALVPSVDRIGRHFPLVILAHAGKDIAGFAPWQRVMVSEWPASVHKRLLSALDDHPPAEQQMLIDGLGDPEAADKTLPEGAAAIGNGHRVITQGAECGPAAEAVADIHHLTCDTMRSIWWTDGSVLVPAQIATFIGMPDISFMVAMMTQDGNVI
jgi:type VI secretion system protein ImpM